MQSNHDLGDHLRRRLTPLGLTDKRTNYIVSIMIRLDKLDIPVADLFQPTLIELVGWLTELSKLRWSQRDAVALASVYLATEHLVFPRGVRIQAEQAVAERVGSDSPAFEILTSLHALGREVGRWSESEIGKLDQIQALVRDECELTVAVDVAEMLSDNHLLDVPAVRFGDLVAEATELVLGGWDESDIGALCASFRGYAVEWSRDGF